MLTSTVGLGAICGGPWMVLRPAIAGLAGSSSANTLAISLAILALHRDRPVCLALPCVFVAGTAMTISGIGAQTLIQAAVDSRMRGRVMALYGMIFRAGPAVGAVLMGSASERFGLRLPLAIGALISCGFWAVTRLQQRRIADALEADPAVERRRANRHERAASLLCFGLRLRRVSTRPVGSPRGWEMTVAPPGRGKDRLYSSRLAFRPFSSNAIRAG